MTDKIVMEMLEKTKAYLDYNATSFLSSGVKERMIEVLKKTGNPSSVHTAGKEVKAVLNKTREVLGSYLEVSPQQFIFTSGGTEANALALLGIDSDVLLISSIEHASVYKVAQLKHGATQEISVDGQGVLNLDHLKNLLEASKNQKVLISVMLANNESGVIEPIGAVLEIAKFYGAFVHVDAVQAFGKIPVSLKEMKVDLMSFSAHKMGGPMGVGALYIQEGVPLNALYLGGGQERGLRAGAENVSGIAGFGKAIEEIDLGAWEKVKSLRHVLENSLKNKFSELFIASDQVTRLPNTSLIAYGNIPSATQVIKLDLNGIYVSSGSACSSGVVKESRILKAMGLSNRFKQTAIRVSMGPGTLLREIERFVEVYTHMFEEL